MKKNSILLLFVFALTAYSGFTQPKITPDQAKSFFKKGMETVNKCRDAWKTLVEDNLWHDWYVIEYADGYCIFNRFKRKRNINDVLNHSIGKGDCDWWAWPEGSVHVCLSTPNNAQYLISKHGKITSVRMIDHPTADCGE